MPVRGDDGTLVRTHGPFVTLVVDEISKEGIVRSQLRLVMLGMFVTCGVATEGTTYAQAPRPLNTYEQNAVKIVSDWTAAWQAKDPDKMAQYVADDIKFRLDPAEPRVLTGRQAFLCQVRQFGTLGNLVIKDVSYQAVGDKVYTLVIQRRTDVFEPPPGGRRGAPPAGGGGPGAPAGPPPGLAGDIPVGAYFLIKNGKIAEWLDVALAIDLTTMPGGVPQSPCG